MSEKISGFLYLIEIAILLIVFIPSTTYIIYRLLYYQARDELFLNITVSLIAILVLVAMIYIIFEIQHLYPRCPYIDNAALENISCFKDRYNNTGGEVIVSRIHAIVWLLYDVLLDAVWYIVAPPIIGISTLLFIAQKLYRRSYES